MRVVGVVEIEGIEDVVVVVGIIMGDVAGMCMKEVGKEKGWC